MQDTLALEQALTLIDNGPDPLLLLDAEDRVVATNAALRALLGAEADGLIGRRAAELAGSRLEPLFVTRGSFAFQDAGQRPGYFFAHDLRLPPGARAVRARLLRDITEREHLHAENERLQAELQAQALYDPLTGLLNPRGLMVALEPQVSRSRRYNSPLAVVVMDVYATQDGLLTRVSQILKDQLRWADVIGHSEDHEFILILPETRRHDALSLTDKLNERLTREFPGSASVWAAYGVVEWQKTDDAGSLLSRARAALAQARAARDGRSAFLL
ncbi:MAG: GGDEF domain-containing protein [Gammaproteobacteria bacterium]